MVLVHDTGKLGTSDNVLLKPASLIGAEHEIIQRYSNTSVGLLTGAADPTLQLVANVARHHHEYFNGSGYPVGLVG